ncbi:hypothetical protein ABIE00_004414 [Arthrobacter sp. OAP107]
MWTTEAVHFCTFLEGRQMAAGRKFAGAVPGGVRVVQKCRRGAQRGPVRAPTSHYALRELLYYTVRELLLTVYS